MIERFSQALIDLPWDIRQAIQYMTQPPEGRGPHHQNTEALLRCMSIASRIFGGLGFVAASGTTALGFKVIQAHPLQGSFLLAMGTLTLALTHDMVILGDNIQRFIINPSTGTNSLWSYLLNYQQTLNLDTLISRHLFTSQTLPRD